MMGQSEVRAAAYRESGWTCFDGNAPVYTPEQSRRSATATPNGAGLCPAPLSLVIRAGFADIISIFRPVRPPAGQGGRSFGERSDLATPDRILQETEAVIDEEGTIPDADNAFHIAVGERCA